MIDLYYWTTPDSHKITVALEEMGTPSRIVPVNISAGKQFTPGCLCISPNNRIPAVVDHAPEDHEAALPVFESGATLEYLADKTGKLLPVARRERFGVLQWLYWKMAGLSPIAGQNHHFAHCAPGGSPTYADYWAFGMFMWARRCSTASLLNENDPVFLWHERLLDVFTGLARSALSSGVEGRPT